MLNNWNSFDSINENLQRALRILRDNKVSETNKNFTKLREIFRRNTGYLGKFTEWLVVQKKSIESLEDLYKKIKAAKITKSIDTFKTPEEVIDYLIREESDIAVNQIITSIPSKTRKFLKGQGCRECDGDGEISCTSCEHGIIECDCRDEDCDECEGEGTTECEDCDGDGEIRCKKCDGEGYTDCKKCNGNGYTKCKKCDDEGQIKCKKCNGDGCIECDDEGYISCEECTDGEIKCEDCDDDGEIKCEDCKGSGSIDCKKCSSIGRIQCKECANKQCKKCEGEGSYKCKDCKGKGNYDCEECKDGTSEWKSFLGFLKLHVNKKDIICDFLSKKGGRYGEDGETDEPLDDLKKDIEKLINMPSIESIKEGLPNEKNVKFIYDDDKILIIASNYEGLQKYGSSYWCITQDRYTFNDYVYEEGIKQQWIVFFKDKSPYIDDRSVMGVTVDIFRGEVSASHWEDDDAADNRFIEKMFDKINLDNISEAESIFNGRSKKKAIIIAPEKHRSEIEKDILNIVRQNRGYRNNVPIDDLLTSFAYIDEDDDMFNGSPSYIGKNLFNVIKSIMVDKKLIFVDQDDNFPSIVYDYDLKDLISYNKNWNDDDISNILRDKDTIKSLEYVEWFISNGYDISKYLKGRVPEVLKKIDIEKIIINNVEGIDTWSLMIQSLTPRQVNNVYNKILKGDKKSILVNSEIRNDSFLKGAISWIVDEDNIEKYKKDILDLINYPDNNHKLSFTNINLILDNIDDDDIERACVYRLLHPKISKKYDFEMKRRVMENLVYWDKFNF